MLSKPERFSRLKTHGKDCQSMQCVSLRIISKSLMESNIFQKKTLGEFGSRGVFLRISGGVSDNNHSMGFDSCLGGWVVSYI